MLKRGDKCQKVRKLQEALLGFGYELKRYGPDEDYGKETETAVSSFKQELIDLTEEEGVSTELQRLIDALVVAEWKRLKVSPKLRKPSEAPGVGELTPEEIEKLISEMYDAFHPLFLGTEETEHAESLQTALKRLGFYRPELAKDQIDGDFGRGLSTDYGNGLNGL